MHWDQGRKVPSTFPCCLPQGPQNFPCCCYDKIPQGVDISGIFLQNAGYNHSFPCSQRKPGRLQKTVGVDIDLHAGRALDPHARQPAAQHGLQIDLAARLEEKPAAVAAA